jgi:hypothetical protein
MIKTGSSLTLASMIVLFAATPTVALSSGTGCAPSDPAALRACFHSAEFNVVDDLSVYSQDLSAFGTARPANGISEEAPVAAKASNKTRAHATAAPQLDAVTLRTFFQSAAFNVGDGLVVYGGDYGAYGAFSPEDHPQSLAQIKR